MKRIIKSRYSIAAAIAFLTFLVYLISLRNNFVSWDDGTYIIENSYIRSLNGSFFKWAFFDFYASNWHPFTWISHALDYAVWGLDPLGHHLTNNILHAINTFIVVLLVVRLMEAVSVVIPACPESFRGRGEATPRPKKGRSTKSPLQTNPSVAGMTSQLSLSTDNKAILIAAATTGLLFGIHPIHVESVAWVSERKDLLCALFFLLSIMMYMSYASHKTYRTYLLSLAFFTFALLSKPMAVSLPVVLLILDWYPFEKILSLKTFMNAVLNKIPFIVLSIVSSVLTMLAQEKAMQLMDIVPWQARILSSAYALFAYIGKMLAPVGLSPFYPYSGNVYLLSLKYFLPLVLLIGITTTLIVMAKRKKLWLALWCYYITTLIPVLGIVQVGRQSMADRYTYLPSIALFLILGLLVATAYLKSKKVGLGIKLACASSVLFLVLCLTYLTYRQISIWNNSVNFWSYVIQQEPEVPFAYYGRGLALYAMGQANKALEDYDRAIALDPAYSKAYATRGFVFERTGDFDKAIADYSKVVALNPTSSEAYNNRGLVFEKMGRFDKAIADYNEAIALDTSNSNFYYNRANAYDEMGELEKAIADYDKAISLYPSDSHAYNNRGLVFEKMGEFDRAIADYDKAVALDPSNTDADHNRRKALENKFRKPIKARVPEP